MTFPRLEGRTTDQHTIFVLQHVDTEFNLATSFLGGRVRGHGGPGGEVQQSGVEPSECGTGSYSGPGECR